MIDEKLRHEIKLKHDLLSYDHDSFDQRFLLVRDSLRSIGDIYSFWIENPELREKLVLAHKNPETIRKMAEKGIRHIKNAWYYLANIGSDLDFYLRLTPKVLKYTNAQINGNKGKDGRYRKVDVTLNFRDYTPPSPGAISGRVDAALQVVNDNYKTDPLLSAINIHLALSLIQPFEDGNKRTARLVQDRLLLDEGYPPAIIPASEGKFYLSLIEEAAPGFRDGNPETSKNFCNYLASKVNEGLDQILNDLNPIRENGD